MHLRLWAAERLAELSGATGVAGASWITRYARALGAKIGHDVDLHSAPPVTGMLKIGRGAAVEPRWTWPATGSTATSCTSARSGSAPGATVGSRSTLLPGARIGKGAEIAPGSAVSGAVPAGQRWAGSPARPGRQGRRAVAVDPAAALARAGCSAYGVTSMLLGLLPAVAALPALAIVAARRRRHGVPRARRRPRRCCWSPPATVAYLVTYAALVVAGVRLLGIGMRRGFHPVHSRVGWQVWATERLMGMARTGLFPLYASLFTPVWLRLLGAKVGRDVEASTVLALPKMTTVGDGAFLADDTMVAHLRARRRLAARRRRRGSASRRSSATPG